MSSATPRTDFSSARRRRSAARFSAAGGRGRPRVRPRPRRPHDRGDRAAPIARVAHRAPSPSPRSSSGRDLGELRQAAREAVAERLRGIHRHERPAQQMLDAVTHGPLLLEPSSSCLIALWMNTLVASSERPSAPAISRLSIPARSA